MSKKYSKSRENVTIDDDDTDDSIENWTHYKTLRVKPNASLGEIKAHFRELVVKFHPDRKTGDATIFAQIAKAYEILSNSDKRAEYDKKLDIEKKSRKTNYVNQKKAFEDFIKAQESETSSKSEKCASSQFHLDFEDLDKLRGIDRSKYNEKPMESETAVKRLRDLEMSREQDEIEFIQPNMFGKTPFDHDKFHILFELKNKTEDDALVKYNGAPSAFNEVGESSFISFNGNNEDKYDNLYNENETVSGINYGSVNKDSRKIQISEEDFEALSRMKMKSSYKTHNIKDDDYKEEIKKRLAERENEDQLYNSKSFNEFDVSPEMGGYGILHQVGLTGKEFEWDKGEVSDATIKKLIEFRQLQDKQHNSKSSHRASRGNKKS